ncbi:endonuclease domain-containing protein [Blastococcus sp. PRF04-17]|uniref:endonuclease domain-containing protein n=1 Tax=Blastococcus sp. PRF04-17 TaxID=2933797 RepID=UPI001FF392AF|nr:endonuclease domain-containing protein [Blastococcus sp. PRF04-17]UOY01426.1 endonuclease domain-containing protein [Blastococcus sp. PRF04-17]
MPPRPARPRELVGTVFRGSAAIRSGRLTRHQLQSSAWQRLFPDVYACAGLPVTHELRTLAATRFLLPGAVASGRSAAVLWGVELAGPDDPVELTVAPVCRGGSVRGVLVSRRALLEEHVFGRRGVPTTTAMRTALDLASIRPLDEAVVALDQFLAPGLVFLDEVRAAAAGLLGRDCRWVRRVVQLADGLAASPQETRLRLLLMRAGLPAPVAQYRVRTATRLVARVDFAWPEHRIALEYEGKWHGEPQNVEKDRRRLNDLSAMGWQVIFVTAADLRDPTRLLTRLASLLGSPRSA